MIDENNDKMFDKLVQRALVPKGFRPTTDEQIAQMLDTVGGVPVSDEKLHRMLRKINGEQPMGPAPLKAIPYTAPELSTSEQGLIALHRAQGGSLPPEIRAKILELERRASQPIDIDQSNDC